MRVNTARLLRRLDELAAIGGIAGGGVCRLAFSEEDKAGRDYIEHAMQELGLRVFIDAAGNILGIREGKQSGPIVLTGSHTDTVATGGRYDGSLGVVAALEVVQRLNEEGIQTEKPIGVISFVNEEGVRFMPDMMGSLYLTGQVALDQIREIKGIDNTTIGQNLDLLNYGGTDDLSALDIERFVELHIEQGPWLEKENIEIGVVERVQGIQWWEYTLTGVANHAGVTPMSMRHDAGYVAAELARHVRMVASEMGRAQRATVGSINLFPNLINVIAEKAVVTVDLRNPDAERLAESEKMVSEFIEQIAGNEGVSVSAKKLVDVAPVTFDVSCCEAIETAASTLGYSTLRMISGAGHDAQIMAARYPSAMIFVPSQDGISHNVKEYTRPEHIEAGANVLLHTLLRLANDG